MRVKMLIGITGTRNGEPWPEVGDEIDLPDAEARQMVANGYAVEVSKSVPAEDSDPEPTSDGDEVPADEPVADEPVKKAPVKKKAKK